MKIELPPELEGEYTIRVMDLPTSSPGFVICDEDNHYNIYLNARYTRESNAETAAHELAHAINDDFTNADPIQTVESRAASQCFPISMGKCPEGAIGRSIPPLLRASDMPRKSHVAALIKRHVPPVPPPPRSPVPLTPYQSSLLLRCIRDLDACFFAYPYEP